MKYDYLYRQVNDRVVIVFGSFQYLAIGELRKFEQFKKIPSISIAKVLCKRLVNQHKHCHLVRSECTNGYLVNHEQSIRAADAIPDIKLKGGVIKGNGLRPINEY